MFESNKIMGMVYVTNYLGLKSVFLYIKEVEVRLN